VDKAALAAVRADLPKVAKVVPVDKAALVGVKADLLRADLVVLAGNRPS